MPEEYGPPGRRPDDDVPEPGDAELQPEPLLSLRQGLVLTVGGGLAFVLSLAVSFVSTIVIVVSLSEAHRTGGGYDDPLGAALVGLLILGAIAGTFTAVLSSLRFHRPAATALGVTGAGLLAGLFGLFAL
jgi:hypothetical protein